MDTRTVMLENLKGLAHTMAEAFGRQCEVVVHDLRDLEHSLVYVAGEITGRPVGSPITDLVLQTLHREGDAAQDLAGYKTVAKDGRVLKSSTAFIRDEQGKIFASVCINYDLTDFLNFSALLQDFARLHRGRAAEGGQETETFAVTAQETIAALVEQAIEAMGRQPGTLVREDRIRFVGILEDKGAFLIKGAIDYVAARLGVSKFTIYNYLNKVRAVDSPVK